MPNLLPQPSLVEVGSGAFLMAETVRIRVAEPLRAAAERLQEALRAGLGLPLGLDAPTDDDQGSPSIELVLDPLLAEEAYTLAVEESGIRIAAGGVRGAHHATQSLLQLLPPRVHRRAPIVPGAPVTVPAVRIEDAPRYRWRGLMLDVARHFAPTAEVLRVIDQLAMHRLNVLHLHLTDDQGWRAEIRRYPLLTEVGGWRPSSQRGSGPGSTQDGMPHGGFYTQDDLREIVAYAAARGIAVVPEIELPGHVQAAIAAYPQLGLVAEPLAPWTGWGINPHALNVEESTVAFFCDVLDEIMEIFPSEVIGIGGDECRKDEWRADARTQELMRERGLATEDELQSWFIARIDEHVRSRGRRLYGWDEILEGGRVAGATVASWRGTAGAMIAARRGSDVVMCPEDTVYLDYRQSDSPDEPIPTGLVTTVAHVRAFDPIPAGLEPEYRDRILGGQANLWAEHVDSARRRDYQLFPRLCALAEALWSGQDPAVVGSFPERLEAHLARLDAAGIEYRPEDGPRPWQRVPGVPGKTFDRAERAAEIARLTANLA
ncbi:beta-N-acetylhexosaminidase [Microbacterium sp. Au-Mic1]|uniref:beta-N-acetylhexosaminidase n=1 Tax=Microbacterium sp. Au-Mic1 TaxID=2906457 RepID=UPI001E61712B|nr:beta-N-acetylhexosaminidase [Microbacterium sp. Au-Mic1]MCE4026192.1 beta-N-acetylhexosaminidase [Microbacterium sp. Au-Mic1]